jgi:hypothetical protein
VLKGTIVDGEGRPVAGARVFVYDSPDIRRSANFISPPTDNDGSFRLVAVPGRYWLVARSKLTEGYGPLLPGDKHSGDPDLVELMAGREISKDFTIFDLKEARKARSKEQGGLVKISGRIVDEQGAPIARAYAFANKSEKIARIPDHVSSRADRDGNYALYLPRGKYYLGGADAFPPGQRYFIHGTIVIDTDRSGVDIVRKAVDSK